MNFTVYKSSAGSGKTFTLVKEYLRLALSDTSDPPQRYRKILAITFTNKAAAEMKERIIAALEELAGSATGELSPMAKALTEELVLDRFSLAGRAADVLRAILHNYTDFAIGTIDSFTHRIVRAFAHDLHLPVNFEVETDDAKLIREAVDILVSRIGEDEKLTDVLVQFSEARTDEQKNWQIERELQDIAGQLLKEEGARHADQLRHLSIDDFLAYRNKLRTLVNGFEAKITGLAKKAMETITAAGLDIGDFASGKTGLAGRLNAYASGNIDNFPTPNSNIEKMLAGGKWHSGKATPAAQAAIKGIQLTLEEIWQELEVLREQEYGQFVLRSMVLKNIYAIAVLNEIEKIIFSFRSEQNILHISEFNRIIARVVFAEPVPFIYERLGEKYVNYLIDEFQDTSVVQWQNLLPLVENALAGNHFTMLVGDGKQAIYRWRGGEVSQFAQLPKVTGHTDNPLVLDREQSLVRNYRERHLAKNFRSKAEIVQFNNAFFRHLAGLLGPSSQVIYDRLEQEFNPENTGGYVRVEALEPEEDEKEQPFLRKTIALVQQLQAEDRPLGEIAILARTNREGTLVATELLEAGIPVLSNESLLLKQSPAVAFMVSLLRCVDHPSDQLAGALALEFLVATGRMLAPLNERLNEFTAAGNNLQAVLTQNGIAFDTVRLARLPLYQRCEELMKTMKLGEKADAYLLFFLDEVLNYTNARNSDRADFFEWWEDRSRKASVVVPEGMNAVTVMTIHKSKGLEFPVVILPFANWSFEQRKKELWIDLDDPELPGLETALVQANKKLELTPAAEVYQEEKGKELLDMLNVLYVAMTRPEQRLYVFTCVTEKKGEPSGISDCFHSALEAMNIPFVDGVAEAGKPAPAELSAKEGLRLIRPASVRGSSWEPRVRIKATSADFWDNEDVHGSRDRGKLLHGILSLITTPGDIDSALETVIQSGLTQPAELPQLKEQLERIVALQDLATCFSSEGKVRRETEILLPGGKRLRPDRVVESGGKTIIVDYKTGSPAPFHRRQLDRYANALKEMGNLKIEKKLVYTDSLKVETWE